MVYRDADGLHLSPVVASLPLVGEDQGVNPQGYIKSEEVIIALKGQKTASSMKRSNNNRENVTVVAAIRAAGVCAPPSMIFKDKIESCLGYSAWR